MVICSSMAVKKGVLYARNGRSGFDSHHGQQEVYTASSFVQSVMVLELATLEP